MRARVLSAFLGGLLLAFLVVQLQRRAASSSAPVDPELPPPPTPHAEVAAQVRQGGLILHFRHGHRQKWDSVWALDVYETATGVDSTQASFRDGVCLSPQGVEEARLIGEVFRLGRVPVGTVMASPICRARQTAMLAFGRIDALSVGLIHTPVTNVRNRDAFKAELRRVLTTIPVSAGANAVIAAHGNTLENHPDLFASGAHYLSKTMLLETGFYVIRRDPDGALHILQRFDELGTFAANVIDLDPRAPMGVPPPAAQVVPAAAPGPG